MNASLGFSASSLTVTLLAVLGIIVLRWFMPELQMLGQQGQQVTAATPTDQWATPFYLRYNTPIPSYLANLMPVPSNYAYALGVPSTPYSQKAATT